jgi:hypothetical protein
MRLISGQGRADEDDEEAMKKFPLVMIDYTVAYFRRVTSL